MSEALTPILVVRNAAAAVDFYGDAFGARETARFTSPSGGISHVDLVIARAPIAITEEARAWNSDSPASLGGSPVVLLLHVDDIERVVDRACRLGAELVFPLVDFCGERMARVRDPFGHLWILSQVLEELSTVEKQRRRDEWAARAAHPLNESYANVSRPLHTTKKRRTRMLGVDVMGSGPRRVMVLNDWLCDTSTWDPSRPYLDLGSFTWAFADLRGYGRSRGRLAEAELGLEEAAADVMRTADGLGWPSFTLVGHSMSTLVALHLAQVEPERIERLVLTTPPPKAGFGYDAATHAKLREVALGDDARRTKALSVMIGERLGVGWLEFKVKRWRETADAPAVAAYVAMFGVHGLRDPERLVACPVLAITGEHDAPPMRREAVSQDLAPLCPRLTVNAIAESGHYPMQETPPLFVATLERFLRNG
jgi:pimeloyl-ACP methyl ester carboxylesterase/uncharacterized glyoxalase superfamily protein PhnB